ncbi:hypothetical protein [Sulfobacillus harzensis]|uniref:Uncharacterized protein n=1 Tax=Sulfobacillus harzensis TaxID=2729629 RepID=A0A7Y0Q4L7_9FIRM|nr:hypothetical protein [Sulfobacillus harzensis]NMP24752.1 hypothetical protein [Sulfobacillus harzensis]
MNIKSQNAALRRKAATINGLIALGATMIGVTVASPIPAFWRGLMTGVWIAGTVGLIGGQVFLQRAHRWR